MSEQNKPTIENVIMEVLEGESKNKALKFASYLNENKLTPAMWRNDKFTWKIPYSEYNLCMIQFESHKWIFTFFFGDYNGEFDEEFITSIQEHVQICKACNDGCMFGKDTTILGKKYRNVCSQLTIQFENPNDKTLENIKTLIEYSKQVVPCNKISWHAHN